MKFNLPQHDAYAAKHHSGYSEANRAALSDALDGVCRDIRIERDALRQAWEGSKQIIKMLEADRDGARYRLLRNANDYQRVRLANYGRDALDEQLDILLGETK